MAPDLAMSLDLTVFTRLRPYVYHLTARSNLSSIARDRHIESAEWILKRSGDVSLLRSRRRTHVTVRVGASGIQLRDQAPLHRGNLALSPSWSFEDLVEDLNRRVFFWPGTAAGPTPYGLRHFQRYAGEDPVIVRVATADLFDLNASSSIEFCRYNSGSPRCSGGKRSPRGPNTFVEAMSFEGTTSDVVEVTLRNVARLPNVWELGDSPTGPWRVGEVSRASEI